MRNALVGQAYVFGADGYFFLDKEREWVVNGRLSGSDVVGHGRRHQSPAAGAAAVLPAARRPARVARSDPDLVPRLHRPR